MLYIQAPFGRGSTTPLSQGIRTSNLRCDWSSFNHDSPPAAIGRLAAPLCHRRPIGCRKRESIVSHCCLCGPDIGVVCVRVSWKEQQPFAQRKQILTPAKRETANHGQTNSLEPLQINKWPPTTARLRTGREEPRANGGGGRLAIHAPRRELAARRVTREHQYRS